MLKFTADAAAFAAALAPAAKVANPRNSAVFGFVLLSADADHATATATDGDVAISVPVAVDVVDDAYAKALLPRVVVDYVAKLPAGKVSITVDDSDVEVRSGRRNAKFATRPVDQFPAVQWAGEEDASSTNVPADVFAEMLSDVTFAASSDAAKRPVLAGVLFEVVDGKLSLVATDSYRMAARTTDAHGIPNGTSVVIPAAALNVVKRFIPAASKVAFATSSTAAFFTLDDVRIRTRLIAGEYPMWRKVVPTCSASIEVDATELRGALDRLALCDPSERTVKVAVDEGSTMTLSVGRRGAAVGDADEVLDVSVDGDVDPFALNGAYLTQALDVVGDVITIKTLDPARPVVIADPTKDDLVLLQMPVRV